MKVTTWLLYAALACPAVTTAFVVPNVVGSLSTTTAATTTTTTQLDVSGRGWDNENFMDSLGKGSDAIDRANHEYFRKSRYGHPDTWNDDDDEYKTTSTTSDSHNLESTTTTDTATTSSLDDNGKDDGNNEDDGLPARDISGASLTNDMKARIAAGNDGSQGGEMFKKLMERAQQGPSRAPPPPPPPVVPPPVAAAAPMPADLNSLSVEEQARLFREMMAQQQQGTAYAQPPQQQPQQAAQYYPPPSPADPPAQQLQPQHFMGSGIGPDGRKIGRNKDADAIVNSADLYFAQLKRDSTTRNYARYAGDDEKANQVFHHPSIHQIKMHVNPYLQEQKEKEKELLETAPDEMLIFEDYAAEPEKPKSYAGISYKEKLAQRKAAATGQPVPPSQREWQAQQAAAKEAATEAPKPIPAVPEEFVARFEAPSTLNAPTEEESVATIGGTAAAEAPPPAPTPETTVSSSEPKQNNVLSGDDTRQDIRTLMGLMLKHRGGPGFGAGRLQGQEAQRLEALAAAVPQALRQEEPQVATPPPAAAPPVAAAQGSGSVSSMIACIEGAITMYKNSPPELQGNVLVTLRAALLAALQTLSQVIDNGSSAPDISSSEMPVPPASMSPQQTQKVLSMLAVIEGAVTMYKNSPEVLQASILGTLSAALMAAVNTFNEILAVGSVAAPVAQPAPAAQAAPAPPAVPAAPQYSGNDSNTIMFEDIYNKVVKAGGDGKMGLRNDLTAQEAKDLQDSLADMRTLLVDELHSGIPEGAPADESESSSSSTTLSYKQMLEKARAEKEAKKGFQ